MDPEREAPKDGSRILSPAAERALAEARARRAETDRLAKPPRERSEFFWQLVNYILVVG